MTSYILVNFAILHVGPEIMACRLFGAKPISKPTLAYFQFYDGTYFNGISIYTPYLSHRKVSVKNRLQSGVPLIPGFNVIIVLTKYKSHRPPYDGPRDM